MNHYHHQRNAMDNPYQFNQQTAALGRAQDCMMDAGCASAPPPHRDAMNGLEKSADLLYSRVMALRDRLDPAMRPRPPEACSELKATPPPAVAMLAHVDTIEGSVRASIDAVEDILGRLVI